LAERYARQNKGVRTILLTPDINFRSMAHGSIVQPADPAEWHNTRRYERLLYIGTVLDDAVRTAHETHVTALIGYYFPWWMLPAIVLAYLALILLIIFLCCLASYLPKLLDAIG
jgi:hypothetical protein